jgi:16S rRNA (guanine966-N2)-methyltransferase
MRVITGTAKGHRLKFPTGTTTRPATDLVRGAIFSILENSAAGWSRVLDIFSGSGALGIEALSRGAARCTFVERARPALAALRQNLARVGIEPRSGDEVAADAGARVGGGVGSRRGAQVYGDEARVRLVAADARRALQADAAAARVYTLVLVDPPYARYAVVERDLVRLLPPVLAPGAFVVVETAREQAVTLPFRERRVKVYGDTRVVFLEAEA